MANINDSVPAAPVGSTNVKWQFDGANASAYVDGRSITKVDLTAQSANLGSTNIPLPSSGQYKISVYEIVTQVDGVSSTLPTVNIGWTDADNATVQTATVVPAAPTGNVLTTYAIGDLMVNAAAGNITYSTSSYASGATPMKFTLVIVVEKL